MTPAELATIIRLKTNTNSTTFTDANMLILVNLFKDEIASEITKRNQSYFERSYMENLVGDQRTYTTQSDILNSITKIMIKFDSSSSHYPATPIKDYMGSETESEIVKNYSNSQGEFAYFVRRKGIFILSGTISAVTNGLWWWYLQYPADLTDMTENSVQIEDDASATSAGFPRNFLELLARRVSIEYKQNRPKPIPLNAVEKRYDLDLERQLSAIAHLDQNLEIIGELPPSSDLGNDGWDY